MISVVHVTHHYGARPILRDIDLRVEAGEVLAVMGPNGMGKSTLLGLMGGTLWPVRGHVEIAGLRRRASAEIELAIRREVFYLTAEPWLPLRRTGREWILAVGQLYGVDSVHLLDRMDSLLDVFDLQRAAEGTIGSCSSGQRKKLALCGMLASEAPILVLDEPFSGGLDPSGILALKRIFQRFGQNRSRTLVYSSPVPDVVEQVATRIIILGEARIVADGTLETLRTASGAGALEDVYQRLVSPQTLGHLEAYFKEAKP